MLKVACLSTSNPRWNIYDGRPHPRPSERLIMKSLGFTRSVVTRSLCRASSRYRFSVPAASASCLRPPSVALGLSGFAATLAAASTAFLHCAAAEEEQATPATAEEADRMFTANEYSSLAALLRAALAERPDDDAELLWRLGRACKKLADEEKPKSPAKQALIREGVASTERALALRPSCGQAHKWHAILLLEVGQFEGTTATIKNSFVVREHFERAVELSPTDATARHLLGLWCFEVAKVRRRARARAPPPAHPNIVRLCA